MAFRNSRGKRKRAVEETFWYVNVFDFVFGLSFAVKVTLAVKVFFFLKAEETNLQSKFRNRQENVGY